jgi:sec-independent protein translocase protein TatA
MPLNVSNERRDPDHKDHTMIENILSPTHLLLILAVALIVLGPKRLPEAGRGLGSAIRGFKESLSVPDRHDEQPAIESRRDPDDTHSA